jgi:CDP-paratose 2-epimerase
LVGSEAASYFSALGLTIVGIDNNMRERFFGKEASTRYMQNHLNATLCDYTHYDADIRDFDSIYRIFGRYGSDIKLVIHTAAQPSHDWAASDPLVDFSVNANGTSVMLEATRRVAPDAAFIFTSTNKVYGDRPNSLPLHELETRWELEPSHCYYKNGIPESMSLDTTLHSLFGASKVAADILLQEYGRYFGMKTVAFRGGCLTGPNHSGTQMHGFLAYLMKCAATGRPYKIFGYKGKQVRDNIHSADLIRAFDAFFKEPRSGEVYNIGGGRFSNCSVLEAITCCEQITGRKFNSTYEDGNRRGDHTWWISDTSKFENHYPNWGLTYNVPSILHEMYEQNCDKWRAA